MPFRPSPRRLVRWGSAGAMHRLYEYLFAIPYLGMVCPICDVPIDDLDTFKQARFGHPGDLVHRACWPIYLIRYPKDHPR